MEGYKAKLAGSLLLPQPKSSNSVSVEMVLAVTLMCPSDTHRACEGGAGPGASPLGPSSCQPESGGCAVEGPQEPLRGDRPGAGLELRLRRLECGFGVSQILFCLSQEWEVGAINNLS
jgi:hypothetical protein